MNGTPTPELTEQAFAVLFRIVRVNVLGQAIGHDVMVAARSVIRRWNPEAYKDLTRRREKAGLPPRPDPEETYEAKAARLERGIRAIAKSELMGADFGDWVQAVCEDLLDGDEAECPNCGTVVHEGPCVSGDAA